MLKILRTQDALDRNDFEEMVAKIVQSQHFWCTDTELSTFLVANIHVFKTRSEIMKKIEKTFDWLNECPECLIAYYKLRETLCRKDNEDILQDLDDVRLFKIIKHSTRIGTTTLTEILTYNWKCLRICELKYNFVQQLKEFYRKENLVFSKMSFSLILLTQCGEPDLLGYVYKIFKYLNKEKLLYLHSGPEEWNYLLEYTGIDERFVPSHSLVAKRDWLMSILIYIGLESTFCTDEIVPIINRIYDQTKDADLKTMCFRVASAYRHRNGSVIKDFDLIFKNIFDDIKAESGKPCTSNVFLRDINLVLISQFRMFCLLRYDQQFYKYYSSKPEYIEAVTSEIVSNCDAIGDFVIFMDRYDFFVQIFSKILDKECTDSKEKKFVEVCMDRFIGNIYRSLRDKNFDVALYHRLFTKWYEISIAATGNRNLFKFFIYLFVFDVEKVLCAYKGSEKLLDVYKLFKKKTLEIFDRNGEPLSDELCFYSLLIKSDFSTYDVQSLVVSENEQHALTHVLKKMNVYFDRFQNFPACFTKMLRIVKKSHLVNYEMYVELFNFLWLGKNSKEILETLAALLPKVRVKCNIRETFLYDLDWIVILEKLDVKLRREVEEFIIAFYSWLRINNIGELPSYKRTRIRNLADYFGIFLINESAKTENNVQPKVKRVKNVPNKFSEEVDSRLEKESATAYKDDTKTHKKKQPTHQQIGPSVARHRNADNQPMVTAEVRTERTKKQNVCANFF
ncbi:hypothetical protein THOM_2261 [Trachipleistophora hominis]|uniref:Uncharacterized protein n=1 Tax=Trachipleistophora hominis TaxID=72359 RepID=L7JTP3_TRAHO|nr:hypothetical protein THOM_2261 [Trachipleistophora hominis]